MLATVDRAASAASSPLRDRLDPADGWRLLARGCQPVLPAKAGHRPHTTDAIDSRWSGFASGAARGRDARADHPEACPSAAAATTYPATAAPGPAAPGGLDAQPYDGPSPRSIPSRSASLNRRCPIPIGAATRRPANPARASWPAARHSRPPEPSPPPAPGVGTAKLLNQLHSGHVGQKTWSSPSTPKDQASHSARRTG